ncbi:MAG: response regulator [Kiloniellales bacterium]|nr:response regulator [Kiloniellales bacterium]
MSQKILLVDDEQNVLDAYRRQLRKRFDITVALGAQEALAKLDDEGPFATIVSDMNMPEINGVQLLKRVREIAPNTIRMMLTGNADQKTAMDAVNDGHVFRFLTKPIEPVAFAHAIEASLEHHRLVTAEKELLEKTLAGSVKVLIDVLSIVDEEAFGRASTLRAWSRAIARDMKLPLPWSIEMGSMLARLGEVTIPAEVRTRLRAGEEISEAGQAMFERVPEISRGLIANIPRLKAVAEIVRYQAKRFDGGGFPEDDLAGEKIPVGARLLKILADLHDYCSGYQISDQAFETLAKDVGAYDPKLLGAVRARRKLLRVRSDTAEEGQVLALATNSLLVGDQLATDVKTANGQLVLAKGHVLSEALIEKLRNLVSLKHVPEPIQVIRRAASNGRSAAE